MLRPVLELAARPQGSFETSAALNNINPKHWSSYRKDTHKKRPQLTETAMQAVNGIYYGSFKDQIL